MFTATIIVMQITINKLIGDHQTTYVHVRLCNSKAGKRNMTVGWG